MTPGGLAVRAVVAAAGVVLLVGSPWHPWFAVSLMVLGLVQAVVWPAQFGMSMTALGLALTWTFGGGLHAHAPVGAAVVCAAALYVLHVATTLAAFVPLGARVDLQGLRRVVLRAVPTVLLSAALVGIDYGVGDRRGSVAYELAGVLAVLLVAVALTVRALSGRV